MSSGKKAMERHIIASAPGNLYILGEPGVVYGYPSINASLERRTHTIAKRRKDKKIIVKSEAYGEALAQIQNGLLNRHLKREELDPILELLDILIRKFKIEGGFELKIRSEIPVESGMSSSSAVLCSVLRAVTKLFGKVIDREEYFDHLYPLQVRIHGGTASGSEIISSSIGGFNKIQKIEENENVRINWRYLGKPRLSIVIGNTMVKAPTYISIGRHLPSFKKRYPDLAKRCFGVIGRLVDLGEKAIQEGNVEELGRLMSKNQEFLSMLMLSHPKLDDCIQEALKAGALGAKLSGSGWGGIMFALVEEGDQEKVAQAIKITGAEIMITEVGVEGVRVDEIEGNVNRRKRMVRNTVVGNP